MKEKKERQPREVAKRPGAGFLQSVKKKSLQSEEREVDNNSAATD